MRSAALLCLALLGQARPDRPNVVLVLIDDFGYECVTANGGESYQTPNVDRLAAKGVRFERCHVQPLCTPTRIELMTGRSNVRNYVRFGEFPDGETTFAQLLKKEGYATGIAGKWQLGRDPGLPRQLGFDEACLWQHTRRPPRYANPGLEFDGVARDYKNGEYGPDLVDAWAREFVARHREKPFFLYYPMMLTHDPYQPTPDSPDWDPTVKDEASKRNVKHFADMVAYMDKLVGRLIAALEEHRVRENTLVLVVGDNGTGRGATSRFRGKDLPGGKGRTTSSGMRVPLIASWPSVLREGRVNADLVNATDVFATVCQAAGAALPEGTDGTGFLPQLRGEKGTPREWLYSWYSPRQGADRSVRECAFDASWKLYRSGEFYDLAADPDEKAPLRAEGPAAEKLRAALDRFKDARPAALDRR